MSKRSRAERKAEEARMIAEMDEAMDQNRAEKEENSKNEAPMYKTNAKMGYEPEVLHCRKCGTQLKDGVCPKCGYKVYIPMDEQKVKRIRLIVGCVCVALCLVVLIILKIKG
jgi:rubrerythrin